jgi:hypothetical protein
MSTNAQLSQQITELLAAWNQREAQFRAWLAGTPTGGPNGDGKYPLSNASGNTQLVDCPAKLSDTVGGPASVSLTARLLSEAARDASVAARDRAVTAETASTVLRNQALSHRDMAKVYRDDAAAFAAGLSAAKTAAEAARDAALASETAAAESADSAADSETNAAASAVAAAASATLAATFDPLAYYTKAQADTLLASKAALSHTHAIADVTGLQAALDAKLATAGFTWAALPGKPPTFAPSAHTHAIADVTGLQAALDAKLASADFTWANLSGKPATFAPSAHTHAIADVTGLQTALDGKQPVGAYLTGITSGMVTTALGFTPYNASNPNGYISGITSGMVTTALGYTPYNASNPNGYISGITSGNVTTALGYTPANRAGDTFTNNIAVQVGSNQVVIGGSDGSIEITRSGGSAYIDFKDSTGEDFDARIQQAGSGFSLTGLLTVTGGGLNAAVKLGNLNGNRDWRVMQKDGGYFAITDETAGAERLTINTAGLIGLNSDVVVTGGLFVGSGAATSSSIYMTDADEGQRIIHTNSNRIGFLTQAGGWGSWCDDDGSWRNDTYVQTPILYDINNTAYYVDPNGATSLRTYGDWRADNSPWTGEFAGKIQYHGNNWYLQAAGNWEFRKADASTAFYVTQVGSSWAANDFRSPMFYDSNDTSFYVNPNGETQLNTLKVRGETQFPGSLNGDWDGGYYHFSPEQNTPNGSWGHAHIIRLDSNWNVQTFWPTANSNEIWTRRRLNGTYSAWRRMLQEDEWIGSKYFGSDGAIYGTIFMDANDGSYYCNPNGTSVLNHIQPNNIGVGTGVNTTWRIITNGANGIYLNGGGYGQAEGSWRAPIFYDSDNTGYYVDPNNTSNLLNINANYIRSYGNVDVDQDLIVGTASGKTASYIYMRDADEGQRIIHTNSNRIGFLTQGGAWGSYCHDDGWWQSDHSMRAPIYYDANNTGYYVNADGDTVLHHLYTLGLSIGRNCASTDVNSANDTGSYSVRGSTTTVAAMSFHRTGAFAINMGLGTDNVFRIGGWSASSNCLQLDSGGNLTALGNVTAYSDARIKKDVQTISGALDMVSAMRGVRYTRIDNDQPGIGVIAQEVREVAPEVVQCGVGDDDTLSVAYGNLVGVLIEAVKELRAEVTALKQAQGN